MDPNLRGKLFPHEPFKYGPPLRIEPMLVPVRAQSLSAEGWTLYCEHTPRDVRQASRLFFLRQLVLRPDDLGVWIEDFELASEGIRHFRTLEQINELLIVPLPADGPHVPPGWPPTGAVATDSAALFSSDVYCPLHGPVVPWLAHVRTPSWTWMMECARYSQYLACPNCLASLGTRNIPPK